MLAAHKGARRKGWSGMEARQARAELTRRRIIDAAIELFAEAGYGGIGIAEIVKRAKVTKGALYYHFASKEAVAAAIIEESSAAAANAFISVSSPKSPALENVIHGMFAVARLMKSNRAANTGRELAQALSQVSSAGAQSIADWTALFVGQVEAAIGQGDVCEDLDADQVGMTIWVSVLGTHLLTNALGDDTDTRLAKVWRVLLRAIVPPESLGYFYEFVRRASVRPAAAQQPAPAVIGSAR